jgi:membrane protease YdiL (CAAX protease family)
MGLFGDAAGVRNVLYLYLAFAFPLIMTVGHHRTLVRKHGEYRGVLLYFAAFFVLFFAVPALIIIAAAPSPRDFFTSLGFTFGRTGRSALLTAIAVPATLLAALFASRDPAMRAQYPFSKEACAGLKKFVIYETSYIGLYYLPWEFLFRGVLFFPLVSALGLLPALAVQTMISTIYHIGHPHSEIYAALGGGLIFGLIAYATGSFLTTFVIHALAGVATDSFLCSRSHSRGQTA